MCECIIMKNVPNDKDNYYMKHDDPIENGTLIRDCSDNVRISPNICDEHNKSKHFDDCHNSSESDSLIIDNSNLASNLQKLRIDKNKFSPGHYLQRVILNSVRPTQKFKSQSLPSKLGKKKYQERASSNTLDEFNEVCVPLSEGIEVSPGLGSVCEKGLVTEGWFKTWPERGNDKVLVPKSEAVCSWPEPNNIVNKEVSVPTTTDLQRCKIKVQSKYRPGPDCNVLEEKPEITSSYVPAVNNLAPKHHYETCFSINPETTPIGLSQTGKCLDKQHRIKRFLGNGNTVSLDELLDSFPLAYSPVTRQLILVADHKEVGLSSNYNSYNSGINCLKDTRPNGRNCEKDLNLEEAVDNKVGGGEKWAVNPGDQEYDLGTPANNLSPHLNVDVRSFSSTVSSLSDISPSTNEDSALGSLLDHGDTCSLVSVSGCSAYSEDSVGEKSNKKSLTGFFSRNVFNWKSGSRSEDSITRRGVGWKLFNKNSSAVSSHASLTVDHNAESDGSSLAPDSPCSVRSCTSGPNTFSHEARVASSSALIQLDRPSYLPAKNEEEDARHRLEYQQMVEAAHKKELKEAKQRKKQLQLQLKAEELLAQSTKLWTCEILPHWEHMHSSKKARELWWQGVPSCVRGKVWRLAIGNPLNLTHSLYDICVQRAQDRLRSGGVSEDEDSDNKEASMQLIQLDISRTFPHLCIFQKGGPYYDMLHCLLAAYVCYRPDVGYVQGMSFIAAVLILNMDAADAFVCFANLLNRPCHMAFFHLNQPLMQAYYSTYDELFKANLPQLFSHFTNTTLSPDLYLLDWLYTVFAKAMTLDLASRVWDVFLRDGEQFLFRTALGVLHMSQETLLKMDFVHGSQFLTKLPDDISGDQLFKSIACIKMTNGKHSFDDILNAFSIDYQ